MKITAIQSQVKRAGRYSIFVDGKYSFSFGESALLDQALHIGQELAESDVAELKRLSGDDKIYNAVLRYIAMRARSEWEITSYMTRKEADTALQQQILNKLSDYGYVNDESFARSWVQNRRLLRPISLRKLQQELKLKHISGEIIQKVLADDEVSEVDILKQLIEKKRRQSRYQDSQKLMQYLAGQGFGYGDIKQALSVEDQFDD